MQMFSFLNLNINNSIININNILKKNSGYILVNLQLEKTYYLFNM